MTSERRNGERRDDPNVWSDQHRKQVQTVYAMVVGGLIVLFGLVIISWAVMNSAGEMNLVAVGIGAGVCLVGLVASMPKTFMPLLSWILKRIPFFKNIPTTAVEARAIAEAADLTSLDITPITPIVPENPDDAS